MTTNTLTGTKTLVRLILRRDRIRIPIWIIAILVFTAGSAASLPSSFPTPEDRQARADLMSNPAMSVVAGPGFGLDDYTFGAMISNELLGLTLVIVALMNILFVIRHTRAEEESGRAEIVRSSMAGRHAATASALIVAILINLLLAGLIVAGLLASISELALTGSVLFGASVAMTGILFATIAAVAAQLSEYGRTATGVSLAALGTIYVLRAVGDAGAEIFSWLSPIGWAQRTAPYVLDRWWPLGLSLILTLVLGALAFWLGSHRDVGGGLLAARPGNAHASELLARPFGLAARLQRGSLIGWGVGLFLGGLFIGSMLESAAEFFEDNPAGQEYLEQFGSAAIIDSMAAIYILYLALVVALYVVTSVSQMRHEETAGHAESVLATAVSRLRWAGGYLAYALLSSFVLLALAGVGVGLGHALRSDAPSEVLRLLGATLVYVPAVWLVAAVAVMIFGLIPRAWMAAWAVPAYAFVIAMLAPLLGFPSWTTEISPFEQTPKFPAEDVTVLPLIGLTLIAAAAITAGLTTFRRRDINVA